MKVCIVGHGPSLKGAKKGQLIDSHDYVVRMKLGQRLCKENPEDYGTKTNVLVASTEVYGCFLNSDVRHKWGYPKNGWYDEVGAQRANVTVELNICNYWNWQFRKLGGKHPNVSTGTAAIILAANFYNPGSISLAGFDTLLNPKEKFSRITEVPRTGSGEFPNHDWEKENELLDYITEAYGVKINPL